MKKTINILLISTVAGILLTTGSCKKFFDPKLTTSLPEGDNYTDYLTSRASVNGLYGLAQEVMTSYVVLGSLRSDELMTTTNASSDLQEIYDMEYHPDNQYFPIRKCYELISNCNDVLFHLQALMDKGTTYEVELDNMYAEAVTMRTWTYFFLVRNYVNVPYFTSDYAVSGGDDDLEAWINANSSGMTTIDQLITDLEGVIAFFDPDLVSNTHYFNEASAYAFLGEMYLWNDDYTSAILNLLAAIETGDGSRFILDKDLENAKWQNIFMGDESATDEIMTKIIFDKGEKQQNELVELFSSVSVTGDELTPLASTLDELSGTYRFEGTFKNDEVGKYTRDADDPFTSDMPVILYRAADVHLMLAEAFNRLGQFTDALGLINSGNSSLFTASSKGVRGRVGLAPLTLASQSSYQDSILAVEDMILQEKEREMAYEGKRWYDLLRVAKRRNDASVIINLMLNRYPAADSTMVKSFYNNPDNWYLPAQ